MRRGRVKRFMGTTQYIVFSMVFLFYALFGDDIRILLASAPDDDYFFAATLVRDPIGRVSHARRYR